MDAASPESLKAELNTLIRDIPDFPKPGILFKDITPVLSHGPAFQRVIAEMVRVAGPLNVDVVVGPESRGFIFGAAVAVALGAGFAPVRKPGKLPHETLRYEYALEYGTDTLELHRDAIAPGQRVLLVDDVLATGGTAEAVVDMVRQLGGDVVAASFMIELTFLDGRRRLESTEIQSIVQY